MPAELREALRRAADAPSRTLDIEHVWVAGRRRRRRGLTLRIGVATVLAAATAGAVLVFVPGGRHTPSVSAPATRTSRRGWVTYLDRAAGFSIQAPSDWRGLALRRSAYPALPFDQVFRLSFRPPHPQRRVLPPCYQPERASIVINEFVQPPSPPTRPIPIPGPARFDATLGSGLQPDRVSINGCPAANAGVFQQINVTEHARSYDLLLRFTSDAPPAARTEAYQILDSLKIAATVECPSARQPLAGVPDVLPTRGQTDYARVVQVAKAQGRRIRRQFPGIISLTVEPRNGQVWDRRGRAIVTTQVADYWLVARIHSQSQCPGTPWTWNGIPLRFLIQQPT
jgi:hypothetical protein